MRVRGGAWPEVVVDEEGGACCVILSYDKTF